MSEEEIEKRKQKKKQSLALPLSPPSLGPIFSLSHLVHKRPKRLVVPLQALHEALRGEDGASPVAAAANAEPSSSSASSRAQDRRRSSSSSAAARQRAGAARGPRQQVWEEAAGCRGDGVRRGRSSNARGGSTGRSGGGGGARRSRPRGGGLRRGVRLREEVAQGVQERVVCCPVFPSASRRRRRGVVLEEAVPEGAAVVEGLESLLKRVVEKRGTVRGEKKKKTWIDLVVAVSLVPLFVVSSLSVDHHLTCKTLLQ